MGAADRAVRRFARATNRAALVGRTLQGLAIASVLMAVALVLARAFGFYVPPSWWWGLFAVPALGVGALRARREALPAGAAAAHLDQRLQLGGMLLTATAAPLPPAYERRLQAALPRVREVLPMLRWRRLLPPALAAFAVLATVACLPAPPVVPEPPRAPAMQLQVERLAEKLQRLEQGYLPDEVEHELQQQLAELRRRLDQGELPEWSALDRLDERLLHESLQQQLRAEDLRQQPGGTAATDPQLAAAVAQAIEALAAAGELPALLDSLPPELRDRLAAIAGTDGEFDAGELLADPQALADLAQALARAGAAGGQGPPGEGLDAAARKELAALLLQRPQPEHVHGPECEGGT